MTRQILVVDDDADIRAAVVELVLEAGYTPLQAENGQVALNLIRDGLKPDAILLDTMMPVMDGKEFFARLPDELRKKVIACTAYKWHPAGAFALLSKPFDIDELLMALAALCGPALQAGPDLVKASGE